MRLIQDIYVRNPEQWRVDTRHVCPEKRKFSSYKEMDGENLFMKNSSTFKVLSVKKIKLNMTFGKLITLNNVQHVANIRKNLMSNSLLSKKNFKIMFESDTFILFKNDMFIEKNESL